MSKRLNKNQTYQLARQTNRVLQVHIQLKGVSKAFDFLCLEKGTIDRPCLKIREEPDVHGLLMILDEFYLKAKLYLKDLRDWKTCEAFQTVYEHLETHADTLLCSDVNDSPVFGTFWLAIIESTAQS